MSIEIKFRGKRFDNGEWVYGSLLGRDIIVANDSVDVDEDYIGVSHWCSVDPETVGQSIGRKEMNGKGREMFKGDVYLVGDRYHVIEWSEHRLGWVMRSFKTGTTFSDLLPLISNEQVDYEYIGPTDPALLAVMGL